MGRPQQTQPQVPVEFIQECFDLRDGCLVWRERPVDHFPHRVDDHGRFNNLRANGPAGFKGPDGRLMVRLQFEGRTRRIAASRVAWCLSCGSWPRGVVRARDGAENNLRLANLIVTQRGVNPAAVGTSSLERRRTVDAKLIEALAGHPDSSVTRLGELAGLTESGVSARLGKLAAKGLAASPMCIPGRAWALTEQGRALAATANPVVLDDRDRQVLAALALVSMGTLKLSRRIGTCPMTAKRRLRMLVKRGLVLADLRKFFVITNEGRQALGDAPQHQPWLRPELVSAASARDVLARHGQELDDRTRAFRSKVASLGAAESMATQRLHKRQRFSNWAMTG